MNNRQASSAAMVQAPGYKFSQSGTLLFITGAPLSGKSTIAALIASSIEGCALQPMDIIRLVAQEVENQKPANERNRFVQYGSCDSYQIVGDGSYSPASLIVGYHAYAEAVSSPLRNIVPKLGVQGEQNVLFEGVQLMPSIVAPYLKNHNRLIIVTSNAAKLDGNRRKMFGRNAELTARYATDRLLLLQEEIVKQGQGLPGDRRLQVDNLEDYTSAAAHIIQYLLKTGVIRESSEPAVKTPSQP